MGARTQGLRPGTAQGRFGECERAQEGVTVAAFKVQEELHEDVMDIQIGHYDGRRLHYRLWPPSNAGPSHLSQRNRLDSGESARKPTAECFSHQKADRRTIYQPVREQAGPRGSLRED